MDTLRLCSILGITDSNFKESYRRAILKEPNRNRPIPVFKELSEEKVASLQELMYDFPGMELQPHTVRYSPYACGGLVIGYTGEISARMLEDEKYAGYQRGDYLGLSGLEKSYEEILRGLRGVKKSTRDNLGKITGSYKNGKYDTMAVRGEDLELYMDIELEQYAEQLMANKLGSLVALDPRNGGVIAMVSTPSFDPNIVNAEDKGTQMAKMLKDATKPLLNRAIQGEYAPGSTFKPLTALVALDEGVITPSFGLGCGGRYSACGGKIDCTHSGGGHAANLGNAMANSCNSYFCHLFRLAVDNPKYNDRGKGLTKWREYMNNFGFGVPLGIDLKSEKSGFIPTDSFYNSWYGKDKWNTCMNCMNGMGQGEVTATPLQMANALCLIANRGYYYKPHFVKSIGGKEDHPLLEKFHKKITPVHIPPESYYAVIAGMEAVIDRGTAKIARIPGIRLAGKTGTAENYALLSVEGPPVKQANHSMFVAYGPIDSPRICVAVVVENSGYGATWAGPIASLVIEKYLTDTIPKGRKGIEKKMKSSKVIPRNVYLIDSIQRMRDKIRMERRKAREDSIKKAKGLSASLHNQQSPPIPSTIEIHNHLEAYLRRYEHIG
jgi:penicillin-binding protein 2